MCGSQPILFGALICWPRLPNMYTIDHTLDGIYIVAYIPLAWHKSPLTLGRSMICIRVGLEPGLLDQGTYS